MAKKINFKTVAIVVAIGVAAYLVYKNWDTIKGKLKKNENTENEPKKQ